MKRIYIICLLLLFGSSIYGQWQDGDDLYPKDGDITSDSYDDGGSYVGHNKGGGANDNQSGTGVTVTLNGKMIPENTMSDYAFYAILYSAHYTGRGASKYVDYAIYETIGTIQVSNIASDGQCTYVRTSETIKSKISPITDVSQTTYLGMGVEINYLDFISYCNEWDDYGDNEAPEYFEIVVVNTKTGYGASSGKQLMTANEFFVDIIDPTQEEPSNKPTLEVRNLIAGCWAQGGTFDLTNQVTVTPADATVTYYTNADGTGPISDPTKVAMPVANPNNTNHKSVVTYYAKASNSDGDSEVKPIEVTVWQKPEVTLALSDGKTAVCNDTEITLKTTNVNSFVTKNNGFHYHSGDATLEADAGDTYKTTVNINATYSVYVTSGDGVGNCKDTASVNVTVIPSIPGGAIQITPNPNKTAICSGESLTLTASVTGNYTGTIAYKWTKNSVDFGTGNSKTDSPTSQTNYAVSAELNGCPSSGAGSLLINVNPLPELTVNNPAASCGDPVSIVQSGDGTFKYYMNDQLSVLVTDPTKVGNGTYYVTKTDGNGCVSEAKAVTTTVHPLPTPKIAVKNPTSGGSEFCAGMELTLQCDNASYKTYTWSGGDAIANKWERKAVIVAGTENKYSLTVVDNNNCSGTSNELAFTGKAAPTVTIDPVAASCAGSEVTLTAHPTWVSGSGTVAWNGNVTTANTATTTATLAGGKNSYSVTVTDGNSCTAMANMDVNGNDLKIQSVTLNPRRVEFGQQVSLDVSATWNGGALGDTDATYSWKKSTDADWTATTKKAVDTPTDNVIYRVTVTKEGCSVTSAENEGEVEVVTDPFNVTEIVAVGSRVGTCDGEELSENPVKWYVSATGGRENYTYSWTVPDGMTVEATDADTLKITAIDYNKLTPGSGHEVSVAVSDGVNTTTKKLYFEVRALPEVQINGESSGGTVLACQNVQTELTASVVGVTSGDDTYLWDGGSTASKITISTKDAGTTTDYTVTATYAGCSNSATVSVTVNALPELTLKALLAGNEVSQVCPDTEITLQAAVSGVDDPDVKWSGAATGSGTSLTSTVNKRSTYIVNYKDNDTQCSARQEVTVDVYTPAKLAVTANPGTAVCAGSLVVLTASNGANYQWSDGSGVLAGRTNDTLMIPQAVNMKYIVNGTDANGCEATSGEVTIQVIEAPKLVLKDKTIHGCQEGEVNLADAVNTNQSSYGLTLRVKKADGTLLSDTKVSEAGTYTLYLDAGGDRCSSNEEKVEAIFHELPTLRVLANLSDVCSGTEVILTAESDDEDTPTFIYNGTSGTSWTVKPANSGITNSQATYTVTAENSYRCQSTADAAVTVKPLPNVQIDNPGLVCAGSQVTLTATGALTYVWGNNGGTANGNSYTVRPTLGNKDFSVVGTAENGCENTANIELDVKDAPVLNYADNGVLTACLNSTVDLKGAFETYDGNLECFEDDQATQPLSSSAVSVEQEGDKSYYVRVKVGDCVSELKPVTVKGLPIPTVDLAINGGVFAVCAGTEVTLTADATGAAEYTWSPGNEKTAAITITPSTTATYKVTVKSTNGCSAEASQELTVHPLPVLVWNQKPGVLSAGGSGTWSVNLDLSTTQPYTYTWKRNSDEPIQSDQSSFRLTDAQMPEENLAVYVTDANGCRSEEIADKATVMPMGGELVLNVTAADEQNEICRNGVQVLTVGVTGGQLPYRYVWYKDDVLMVGDTTVSITVSDAATYKVEVTDGGKQTKSADLAITMSDSRIAPTVVIPEQTIRTGLSAVLLANVTPTNGTFSYQWAKMENLKDAGQVNLVVPETKVLTEDTEYTVLVKDETSGCYASASGRVVVDDVNGLKVLASASVNSLCRNSEVQLSADVEGSANVTYKWREVTGLSDMDIKNPLFTASVEGTQEFVVTVTDDGGRMAAAKVSVTVEDKTAPKLILSSSDQIACSGDKITVRAEEGTVIAYQWFVDDQEVTVAGTEYVPSIGENQKVKVTATADNGCEVKPVENTYTIHGLPEIAWKDLPQDGYSITTPLLVSVKLTNETQGEYMYHWLKPNQQDVAGNLGGDCYSVQTPTEDHYDFQVYVSDFYGCQSDTLKATVNRDGSQPIEIEVKDVNACAVAAGRTGTATLSVTKTAGPDAVTYTWKANGHSLPLSDENTANATVDIAGAAAGLYSFTITVSDAGDNTNKVEESVLLTIAEAPNVSLAEHCVALHKDSVFVLTIANSDECDYLWQQSVYGTDWETPTDKGTGQDCEVTMGEQDMRYILIATNTESQCSTNDTAMIYRIPDAPKVEIDTNLTHLDIKLSWGNVTASDGYTVWSRKWDPYCLTTADGGAYTNRTSTTRFEWAVDNMDTLEFFYVTADKNVCGTTYYSQTSDTVGYKLDLLQKNIEGRTSNNPVMWVFDMPSIQNTGDLLLRLGPWTGDPTTQVCAAVRKWVLNEQSTSYSSLFDDTYWMFVQAGLPTDGMEPFVNRFDLAIGEVYEIDIYLETNLLQYGKLSKQVEYYFENTPAPMTDNNMAALALHKANYSEAFELIDDLKPEGISKGIYMWDFIEQAWSFSTTYSEMFDTMLQQGMSEEEIIGYGILKYDVSGETRIYPTMPMLIDVLYMRDNNTTSYIWK